MAKNEEVPAGFNKVSFYANLYRSYLQRNKTTRFREDQNWRMYSGVGKSQWDPDQLEMLIQEKRAPHQVNFTQQKVNSLLGNALQNELETEFVPRMGTTNDATLALNSLFLTDKDFSNWSKAKRLLIRGGLIMRGSAEMFVDYKEDPQGRVGFRYLNHNRIMYDPDWTSDNINDNKHIIQWAWMDPEEINLVYDKKSEEIESAIRIWREQVSSRRDDMLEIADKSLLFSEAPEFTDILNGRFLVIQTARLERVSRDRLFDMDKGDFLPEMSKENMQAMMGLRGKRLKVLRDKVGICKVTTVVPGLSTALILEDGNHPVQIGRYPYFTWSYMNINGEPAGVVDVLKDLQQIYNKRESAFTHWQTTAVNGAEFVEEDFFANETEYSKYVNQKNIPGGTFQVQAGRLSRGSMGIASRPRDNIPNDLHVSADRALNMTNEVIPVTPALSGGEGKSGESGRLFAQKRAQALISIENMTRSLEEFEHEFGEAYFKLAKILYSGAPRQVFDRENRQTILLNIPTKNGQILNDIGSLGRHDVRISKSKRGVSVREELLNRYVELMPFFQNPKLRAQVEKMAIGVLPNIPDKEIEKALQAAEEFEQLQDSRILTEKMQNMLGIATAQQQLQQFSQPQIPQGGPAGPPAAPGGPPPPPEANPGRTPAGGGGLSVEGKQLKPGEVVPADVRTVNQLNK